MRILHVNKFAYSRGGAEIYMMQLAERQQARGDSVAVFGNTDPSRPLPTGLVSFHYGVIDFHDTQSVSEKARAVKEVMWSSRAAKAVGDAIDAHRPDVVHLHNYSHQLSSSIIAELRKYNVRTIGTAHDYKIVCPAYVANRRGADCFACAHRLSPKLLRDRCHHGSLAWSGLVAAEAILVRGMKLLPDAVIAPSQYMADALNNSWASDVPVTTIRNPAQPSGLRWTGGGYVLYVGRLSREKGVESLIAACVEAGIELVIAGEGPLRTSLEEYAAGRLVRFVGHVSAHELAELRMHCRAQVVPSEWPENAPLSALEAAIDGVPLITSSRGGLPEFEKIGAHIAFVEELTSSSLSEALAILDDKSGDLETLRTELSWQGHLKRVDGVYKGDQS